jgi:hypothetical protein
MSDPSYKIKPRPNIFDLAIMDGFLSGGGTQPAVQREAYWAEPPQETPDRLFMEENRQKPKT